MGDPRIHVILTRYPSGGFGVSSPQLPELVAGFDTEQELEDELLSILTFGGAPKEYQLEKHYQEYSTSAGREWFVRTAHDLKLKDRATTLRSFVSLIHITPDPIDRATKSTTGEATFVIAVPDDTVGWLAEQLTFGCALTVVVRDGRSLTTFDLLTDDLTGGLPTIKADPERTVGEILAMVERTERHVPGVDFLSGEPIEFFSGEPVEHLITSRTLVSV